MRSENSNEVLGSHYRASMAIDDGSSIDIIPPHMSPDVSSFHGTATTSDHDWMTTRLSEDDLHDTLENSTESTRVENEVMREVTRWVQAYHCDDFWMPRNKGYQPVCIRLDVQHMSFSDHIRLSLLQIRSLKDNFI